MEKRPTGLDRRYEIYQTVYSKYQGVYIIARRDLVKKWSINDNNWIIGVQCQDQNQTYFIIGAYFKHNIKDKILAIASKLIKRIRKVYTNLK